MTERQLLSTSKRLRQQLTNVNAQLNAIKAKKELPRLREQYLGKYFKYRNCYSCPQMESDYWFIYYHVRTVDGQREMYAVSSEITKDGDIRINPSIDFYPNSDLIEINAEEYQKAISELRIDLAKILR